MISVIITGRNDDYGGDFESRLFASLRHNLALLHRYDIPFELLFIEWNPLPDKPLLSEKICRLHANSRGIVVPPAIHQAYSTNPNMPFCEMPAKNVGIRQAKGDTVLILNGDILLSEATVKALQQLNPRVDCFYRCQRIDIESGGWGAVFDETTCRIIPNGEENRPPVRYLGAGGDFCFARKSLFLEMTGFDEKTRFTTRAKDWEFFISAIHRGFQIEFIGKVYHLDHSEGFRHTSETVRNTSVAHFGGYWNFSADLPYENHPNWGLQDLHCLTQPLHGVWEISTEGDLRKRWSQDEDERMQRRYLPHNVFSGAKGAMLMHLAWQLACGMLSGNCRLTLNQPDTYCQWEVLCGALGLVPETYLMPDAEACGCRIQETSEGFENLPSSLSTIWKDILKELPEFNPFLLSKLALAYRYFYEKNLSRILMFGAGQHTRQVLAAQLPEGMDVVGLLETGGGGELRYGLPVIAPESTGSLRYDAVLISSVSFETEMRAIALDHGLRAVYALYEQEV